MILALHVDNLSVARGDRMLFEALGLTLRAGSAVALTGANGSGKTSLLRAIAGLLRPAAGAVWFEGPGGRLEPEDARSRGIHLVGHQDGLKGGRTAEEELAFQGVWTGAGGDAIEDAVDVLGLAPLLALEVRKLSAGQRRRLALARLIAAPRDLWLLDEPLSPLDARTRGTFGDLMSAHLAAGGMIVAAVHDPLPIPAANLEIRA